MARIKVVMDMDLTNPKRNRKILRVINALEGVEKMEIYRAEGTLEVTGTIDPMDLIKRLRKASPSNKPPQLVTVSSLTTKPDDKKPDSGEKKPDPPPPSHSFTDQLNLKSTATIQQTQEQENRSTILLQTSTISTHVEDGENLLIAKANSDSIIFGSEEVNKDVGSSESVVVNIPLGKRETTLRQNSNGARKWEVQKAIVVGGLFESITSLVIVTAAASVNISIENIVALAMTNLISGLFVVTHNLSELKIKNRLENECNGVEGEGIQYKEVLIDKMHYLLHFTMAFLSFLYCGLLPPLVYAFSFAKTGNKNLKMIATAGASLSCTAILALQKAHIQKPQNCQVYIKTATTHVSVGLVAFGLSYLSGYMIGQLTDRLVWS